MSHSCRKQPVPVVILNWNGIDDTLRCVDHLLASRGTDFRAVVVDNASNGDEYERLTEYFERDPSVEIRRNERNLGFARGVNRILVELLENQSERPEYVALLNNDAFPEPDWLMSLVQTAERFRAGAVTSCMLREDDPALLDNAGHVFLNTGEVLPRGAGRPASRFDEQTNVTGVCGGACLLRLDMLAEIGIFDEFYTTGYEDAELGLRAMRAGYTQVYEPNARVRHKIGASIDKIRDKDFAVALQVNINYAYFKLMPWAVITWNMPWILVKQVVMLLVPGLIGRWRLLRVQWAALAGSIRVAPRILSARRQSGPRRLSTIALVRRQSFFLPFYTRYFIRFVIGRRQTIFERWE
ncbi:MAG TPA: glycosyltransferase family 2 protein [Alphaproteobacteria bacterium]|nr:glycosyltransferase family 2 protein [Alphaproteobacteria bacterium]